MRLAFTKMHGLGNDFIVVNAMIESFNLNAQQVAFLADRHFGIGCDQLLVVEPAQMTGADFRYRIFNADGSEVEQCGNGARCFAKFVRDEGLTDKTDIPVETAGGLIVLHVGETGEVTVDMGTPIFDPAQIPFDAPAQASTYAIEVADEVLEVGALSMGNPHVIVPVLDVETTPVTHLGAELESHPRFPQRVNVGFMQVVDSQTIKLRVYERGAGETLACGTGACAAAVFAIEQNLVQSPVTVRVRGGNLTIAWQTGESVMKIGPAATVFKGEITLD